jgi:glutamate/aspartate transport system permease protein
MQVLFDQAADGGTYLGWLMSGLFWTLLLWFVSGVLAFAIGIGVGAARTVRHLPLRIAARLYVQVFRNVPLLVQMFLWYFVLPEVIPTTWGSAIKQIAPPWASFYPAVAGLSLYTASRIAEQVRAGVNSLSDGQRKAEDALGLTAFQTYVLVLLPQALRITIPTLTSEALGLLKNTSVALTIGLLEITARAAQINEFTFRTFDAFASATILYLLIALVLHQVAFQVERILRIPGTSPNNTSRK